MAIDKALLDDLPLVESISVVGRLAGGPASDSYLLESGDRRLVLRIDRELVSTIGLDRKAEADVLNTVAAADVGPQVVWADPAGGILVTEYLDGDTWNRGDLLIESNLARLGRLLKKLHALVPAGPVFQVAEWAARYSQRLQSERGGLLADRVKRLDHSLKERPVPAALCHNDPIARNVIDCGVLRFIDWEYAGIGDPYFDLAVITAHHELSDKAVNALLKSYLGAAESADHARLALATELYDCLHLLWLMLVIADGSATPEQVACHGDIGARLSAAGA